MKPHSLLKATLARSLVLVIGLSLATINYPRTIVPHAQRHRVRARGSRIIAATPPMGWNSWDSYSRTLDEKSIKANALWLAHNLKRFGWEYVVVDEGWYLAQP